MPPRNDIKTPDTKKRRNSDPSHILVGHSNSNSAPLVSASPCLATSAPTTRHSRSPHKGRATFQLSAALQAPSRVVAQRQKSSNPSSRFSCSNTCESCVVAPLIISRTGTASVLRPSFDESLRHVEMCHPCGDIHPQSVGPAQPRVFGVPGRPSPRPEHLPRGSISHGPVKEDVLTYVGIRDRCFGGMFSPNIWFGVQRTQVYRFENGAYQAIHDFASCATVLAAPHPCYKQKKRMLASCQANSRRPKSVDAAPRPSSHTTPCPFPVVTTPVIGESMQRK